MIEVAPETEASIKREAAEQGVSEETIVSNALSAYRREIVPAEYEAAAELIRNGDDAGLVALIGRDIPSRAAAAAARPLN